MVDEIAAAKGRGGKGSLREKGCRHGGTKEKGTKASDTADMDPILGGSNPAKSTTTWPPLTRTDAGRRTDGWMYHIE